MYVACEFLIATFPLSPRWAHGCSVHSLGHLLSPSCPSLSSSFFPLFPPRSPLRPQVRPTSVVSLLCFAMSDCPACQGWVSACPLSRPSSLPFLCFACLLCAPPPVFCLCCFLSLFVLAGCPCSLPPSLPPLLVCVCARSQITKLSRSHQPHANPVGIFHFQT